MRTTCRARWWRRSPRCSPQCSKSARRWCAGRCWSAAAGGGTGELLQSALHLLEALRPPRALIGNEVAGHKCPEGLGRLSSAHVLIGNRITSEAYLCKEILGPGASGADVEQRGRAQRHAPALAGEIVLDPPSRAAACAEAQSEAANLVIPESLVLRARRQHQRLGGSRC